MFTSTSWSDSDLSFLNMSAQHDISWKSHLCVISWFPFEFQCVLLGSVCACPYSQTMNYVWVKKHMADVQMQRAWTGFTIYTYQMFWRHRRFKACRCVFLWGDVVFGKSVFVLYTAGEHHGRTTLSATALIRLTHGLHCLSGTSVPTHVFFLLQNLSAHAVLWLPAFPINTPPPSRMNQSYQ